MTAEPDIADYAIIGNCRTSALISREGSIDWLCLPRPESPSIFAAILDAQRGGRQSIRPKGIRSISRRYVDQTNVLETTFTCDGGVARLTDSMHVCSEWHRRSEALPDDEIGRRIECLSGEVDIEVEVQPRPDYARRPPRLMDCGRLGLLVDAGERTILIRSDIELKLDRASGSARGEQRLRVGQRRWLALSHTMGGPGVLPMLGVEAERRLERSIDWWRRWLSNCNLPATARHHVQRSALALKLLVFPPSGAVVAAPTTSLPEEIGGVRNWDYRYCWIRDASLTMRAFLTLGLQVEAHSFFSWLLYATRLTRPRLQVLYDVHGRTRTPEREITSLSGYRDSRPVRIGNAASEQRQLDNYGALLDAAWQYHACDGKLSRTAGRMLRGFVHTARDSWRDPDSGIWEIRSGQRHHTLSKAMCWVAMERGLRLAREGVFKTDQQRLRREMDEVRDLVRREGFDPTVGEGGAYVSTLHGDAVDASLLLLGIYGFEERDSPRMLATIDRIYERLGHDGLLHRYVRIDDGIAGGESTFGICGFWGVEALAMSGQTRRACEAFERLLSCANDVGLYAEEIHRGGRHALGNFPQAFTHVGLINAAWALDGVRQAPERGARASPEKEVG